MKNSERARYIMEASRSMLYNLPTMAKGHKFKALSLAALDYTSQKHNLNFTPLRHQVVAYILSLGIVINDYYDIDRLDKKKYRQLRKSISEDPFMEEQYHAYFKSIRQIEQNRPLPGNTQGCIDYREKLNLISLAVNCSLAFEIPLTTMVDTHSKVSIKPDAPVWFQPLFFTVMALQVVDDMIGCQGDSLNHRPSFFTAFGELQNLTDIKSIRQHFSKMGKLFNDYLEQAKAIDPGYVYPFILASKLIYSTLPKIAEFLHQPGLRYFASVLLTDRDIEQK